ncbi:hypothetical protein L0F63_007189 [Massospora cicadina]|nr:hypothetical protein L0F63_007189 [Massospora cicadina]
MRDSEFAPDYIEYGRARAHAANSSEPPSTSLRSSIIGLPWQKIVNIPQVSQRECGRESKHNFKGNGLMTVMQGRIKG